MKKFVSMFLLVAILAAISVLPAFAAGALNIDVYVYDTSSGSRYLVGTDTVNAVTGRIQSENYVIKPVASFTEGAGNVSKVSGNWYFPTGDRKVGDTVQYSSNGTVRTLVYWVDSFKQAAPAPAAVTGANRTEAVNLGGSGSKVLTYTVNYHSNYPDGKDFKVSVKYTVKSYTAKRNMFSSEFKSYNDCGFSGYPLLDTNKTWYSASDASAKKSSIYAESGKTYDLYAGWVKPAVIKPEAVEAVTLQLFSNDDVYAVKSAIKGDRVAVAEPEAKADSSFLGWATSENSSEVAFAPNDELVLSNDLTLYAVWQKAEAKLEYNGSYPISNNYAYLFGMNDTTVGADENLCRGQACAVLYRILKQNDYLGGFKYNALATPKFFDLAGRWDRSAVEYMTHLGIYKADSDAWILPDDYITRGEAFKVFAISMGCTSDTSLTYEQYTEILVKLGYVGGDYAGSTDYRINDRITRAEFCKIFNIALGRDDSYKLELADGTPVGAETYGFKDLPEGHWAYEIILRAVSAFDSNKCVDLDLRGNRNALDDYQ